MTYINIPKKKSIKELADQAANAAANKTDLELYPLKIVMEVYDMEAKLVKSSAVKLPKNYHNFLSKRIKGVYLSSHVIYALRKHGVVSIETETGGIIYKIAERENAADCGQINEITTSEDGQTEQDSEGSGGASEETRQPVRGAEATQ